MRFANDFYLYGVPALLLLLGALLVWGMPRTPLKRSLDRWAGYMTREARGSVLVRLRRWPYPTPWRRQISREAVYNAVERGDLVYYQLKIPVPSPR